MLNIILKIDGVYIIWSEKERHPITHAMTKDTLFRWIEDNEGQDGVDAFKLRLDRCDKNGCSSAYYSIEDLLSNNRAGDNFEYLNKNEIIEKYGIHSPHNIKFRKKEDVELGNDIIIDKESYNINSFWRISNKSIKGMMLVILICLIIQSIDYFYKPLGNFGLISLAIEMYIIGILSSAKLKIWSKKDPII